MTLKGLAKEIGCSRATLDRVLHNREGVSESRRKEILEKIKESGYKPNKIGKILAKQNQVVIGIIIGSDIMPIESPLFEIVYKGMLEGTRELEQTGVKFIFRKMKSGKATEQIRVIQELVESEGVSGIAFSLEEKSEKLNKIIKDYQEKGIYFISYYNSNVTSEAGIQIQYQLGIDQRREGYVAAGLMGRLLGKKGKVALISGLKKNAVHQIRVDSANELLGKDYPEIEVLPIFRNSFPEDTVENLCDQLLEEHSDLSGIIVSCGYAGILTDKIQQAGKKDQITIVLFDFTSQAELDLEDGKCDAVIGIDLRWLGYKTVYAIYELVFQNEVSKDTQFIPLQIKLKESVVPL